MTHPDPDGLDVLPVPIDDDVKLEAQHVETVKGEQTLTYDAQESPDARKGWRRIFKKNPSEQFIRDVMTANEEDVDPKEIKKLNRKLYWLIVPALAIDYMWYYVDKTTLSYAAIYGIKTDLHLVGSDYNNLSSIFYIGWLVWAIPGNLLMTKFPLAKYLAVNIFLWGVLLMAQSGSKSYADMMGLRFASGMFEAVADPCFVSITGLWFTRKQQPVVIGLWYVANGVGIALGGLFGFGIGHIGGSLAPWKYEFLIIGAVCSAWAIVMGFLIPDAPHSSRWLTQREGVLVYRRKRDDHYTVEKRQLKMDQVKEAGLDPKILLYFFLGFFANVPNGGTSNFGTLITQGIVKDTFTTTLLQIPYGAFIAFMILLAIFVNYKTHHLNIRTYLMAGVTCLTVLGFAMLAFIKNTGAQLAGYYLTGSSNAVFVLALSLISGNVGGSTKKVLASASIFIGVAVGNIVGPYAFLTSEAPVYRTGIIVCMASRAAEIVVILLLRACFVIPNKRRDKKFADGDERYDPHVLELEDLGDHKNLHFRYIS